MAQLSVKESINFGWTAFWQRPWFFVGAYLIIGIVSGIRGYDNSAHKDLPADVLLLLGLVSVAAAILQVILRMGEKRLLLNAHENVQSAKIEDLWTIHPFWRFVGGNILYGLIVVGGLILLIVPGIIWSIMFMFTPFLIIDRGLMPMDALRESARITNGHKWQLLLLGLALAGINILGFLCLIVGLLVTIPVSALAGVYAYRFLEHQASEMTASA